MLLGFNFRTATKFSGLWKVFSEYSIHNPDGWGIAIIVDNMPFVVKRGGAAHRSRLAKELHNSTMISKNGIFHLRFATKGKICAKNAHPFSKNEWTFAHNGHVAKKLSTKTKPIGETDSELAFCYLYDKLLENNKDEWATVSQVIQDIGAGFNFLLAKEDILYAYWSGYNSLYLAKIKDLGFIVCTYPILKGNWVPFEEGELIKFQKGQIIQREQFYKFDEEYSTDYLPF